MEPHAEARIAWAVAEKPTTAPVTPHPRTSSGPGAGYRYRRSRDRVDHVAPPHMTAWHSVCTYHCQDTAHRAGVCSAVDSLTTLDD
jgi:hypothetical protein